MRFNGEDNEESYQTKKPNGCICEDNGQASGEEQEGQRVLFKEREEQMEWLMNMIVLVVVGKITLAGLWIGLQIAFQSLWGVTCLVFFATIGTITLALLG